MQAISLIRHVSILRSVSTLRHAQGSFNNYITLVGWDGLVDFRDAALMPKKGKEVRVGGSFLKNVTSR